MKKFSVHLHSINDVKNFVNITFSQPFDVDIVTGRYIVDAKSILGLFSLDLTNPISVQVHGTLEESKEFYEKVKEFVV